MVSRHTDAIAKKLRDRGVSPTAQRVRIAELVLMEPNHFTADQVFEKISLSGGGVSRATVYNTLSLFLGKSLLSEVVVDPGKRFYDSTTEPHHHIYDIESGELIDIENARVSVSGLPPLPEGKEVAGINAVVRIRTRS
jgi:Fur family iron response transcriptional regulator